ncbi:hypothetical protein [Streptomyces monashensis]|uniref:Uncharacterized protein n=1 Tax=Streptomyces monashensis TaxID=1678012 RepID=A0A1S2QKL3_9ACTN|nr:hypothetical protein [Streptomyces monashensis]OIK06708.1 hypothetical protein BIV23_06890 [Streptomyces monashensis]
MTPVGNAAFVVRVHLAQAALIALAPVLFATPWWFPLALLRVPAVRPLELTLTLRAPDLLRARRPAIRNHRLAVLLLLPPGAWSNGCACGRPRAGGRTPEQRRSVALRFLLAPRLLAHVSHTAASHPGPEEATHE